MEMPVPQVDRAAYDREKYEIANYKKPGMVKRSTAWISGTPDVSHAAKSGAPTMTDLKPTIPVSVPVVATAVDTNAAAAGSGTTDVTATPLKDSGTALDKQPDARSSGGTAPTGTTKTASTEAAAANQPLPTNRDKELKKLREEQAKKQAKLEKKKKKQDQQKGTVSQQEATQSQQNQSNGTQGAQTPTGTPAASTPAAAAATTPPGKQPGPGGTPQSQ
jgi:hypothetical protein